MELLHCFLSMFECVCGTPLILFGRAFVTGPTDFVVNLNLPVSITSRVYDFIDFVLIFAVTIRESLGFGT